MGRDGVISGDNLTTKPTNPSASIDLETPTRRGDVIAAALCMIAALIGYFILVPGAVHVPAKFAGTVNSPAFLPKVLFFLLGVFSAAYLVQSITTLRREQAESWARTLDWALAGGTAAICIAYVAAIEIVGMSLASALAVAATMYFFGERRPVVIGAIAIVLPGLLWYFFVKIAHILFPTPALGIMEWLESGLPLIGWAA